MKEWYSLKECAEILHLSKNTIKYRATKLSAEQVKQVNGKWFVSATALESMREFCKGERDQAKKNQSDSNYDLLIEMLRHQITELENQIQTKDTEIMQLHQLLAREQERALLTDTQRVSWWQRTFGKRESKVDSVN